MADGPIPTGRIRRSLAPVGLAARAAATSAAGRLKGTPAEERRIRTAEQAVATLGQMKGAVMKMGQLLSFVDTGLLPEELATALGSLQADAPPMALELVESMVEAELGAPPSRVFDWFSPEPMAAASIGQVHAARLDGRELVVKVQYPGVADAIAADLSNTALVTAFVNMAKAVAKDFAPKADLRPLADEIVDRVLEELDYRRELANQQEFARIYAGHPFIRIPEAVPDLSTGRVLTMEHVDAMRWQAAVEAPADLRNTWAEVIDRFVYGSLYREAIFNGDPHPGNYLFHDDGTVTFVDFGSVKRFSRAQADALARTGIAVIRQDADALRLAFVDAGFMTADDDLDPQRLLEWASVGYEPLLAPQPFTFTREFARAAIAHQFGLVSEHRAMAYHFEVPWDFVRLSRITVGVHFILTGREATNDWRSIAEEQWLDGPPSTALGEAEAAWRLASIP